jgi:hypothetical protein
MRIQSDKIQRPLMTYDQLPANDPGRRSFQHHKNDTDIRFVTFGGATWALSKTQRGEHPAPDGWTHCFSFQFGTRIIFNMQGETCSCGFLYL